MVGNQNPRAVMRSTLLIVCATVLMTCFQNCNSVTNGSKDSSTRSLNGGEGTDGKLYRNYGLCTGGAIDVANVVKISSDRQSAKMIRQDCADLSDPPPVAITDLKFGMENSDAFVLNGNNYDRQSNLVSQQVTVQWCRSGSDDTEVRIWKYLNSSSGYFGSVTLASGTSSEVLLLDSGSSGPSTYASAANQPSQFSLTANGAVGSLSYSIDGGATKNISNLNCGTQGSPAQPTIAPSLAAPAGYSSTLLAFEDRFSSLDGTKWIPQIADQNGIWRQSVAAPYSAPNSGGYEAQFYDPQHVITGGGLNLVATKDSSFAGYAWRSGCVSSHGLFYLHSGYVQILARFPDSASGMWAGINFYEGGSSFGIASGYLGGVTSNPNQNVFGNLLSPGNSQVVFDTGVNLSSDYHVYGVEYRPGVSLKMYVDGKLFASYTGNVPTGAYEIVLNLAVAQNAAAWHTLTGGLTLSPSEFDISDVQVYNLPP